MNELLIQDQLLNSHPQYFKYRLYIQATIVKYNQDTYLVLYICLQLLFL